MLRNLTRIPVPAFRIALLGVYMLRIFLFLLFTTPALAQQYDLSTMPDDYGFTSIELDARVTVSLAERKGQTFVFNLDVEYYDGTNALVVVETNIYSQATAWRNSDTSYRFSPSDCVPQLGLCEYTWEEDSGSTRMRVNSRKIEDIWIIEEYSEGENEWLFYSRTCTIFDEYGFWYDSVRTYWDGKTEAGYRERVGETRLKELWSYCDPPALTS